MQCALLLATLLGWCIQRDEVVNAQDGDGGFCSELQHLGLADGWLQHTCLHIVAHLGRCAKTAWIVTLSSRIICDDAMIQPDRIPHAALLIWAMGCPHNV